MSEKENDRRGSTKHFDGGIETESINRKYPACINIREWREFGLICSFSQFEGVEKKSENFWGDLRKILSWGDFQYWGDLWNSGGT